MVDASAIIAWLLPEDRSEDVSGALADARRGRLIAPPLLDLEVANVLRTIRRRGDIDDDYVEEALARYFRLKVAQEGAGDRRGNLRRVSNLARDHDLTIYDAAYLELALRSGLGLISLDRALRRAAEAEGVPVAPA